MTGAPKGAAKDPPNQQTGNPTEKPPTARAGADAPGAADFAPGEVWVAIPARHESVRFPGKPLTPIAGKPMIQHVHERTRSAPSVTRVLVATDSDRIAEAVAAFGGEAVLTGAHPTGTDRIAEAVRRTVEGAAEGARAPEWVLNVQGDEPLIDPGDLETLVRGMRAVAAGMAEPSAAGRPFSGPAGQPLSSPVGQLQGLMGTLVYPLESETERSDPNVVKAVLDGQGRALYFTRAPAPYPRGEGALGWRHMGVYLFRTEFLYTFAELAMTPLARREELEQLRALENGYAIHCFEAANLGVGVDVPADVAKVEALLSPP